jgi:hypothetical protein
MKKFLLHTLLLCFAARVVLAQTIPSSSPASNCSNCVPVSWNIVSGQPSGSNITVFGTTGEVWDLPDPPSGNSRFITEKHNASGHHDVVSTNISGLVVGKSYRLSYNVITSDPSDPTKTGGYSIAKSASISINSNGTITSQTTNYSGPQDPKVHKWTHNEITFLAKGTTATLTFTGTADYTYNPAIEFLSCPWPSGMICPPKYGVIGLDIEGVETICNLANDQVVLLQDSLTNICPATTVNLNSALSSSAPNGLSYVWYPNQNHSGTPVDPTSVSQSGPYYAFLFDPVAGCYNTNVSQARVVVTIVKCCSITSQVQLNTGSLNSVCPATTVNLNSAYSGAPPHNYSLVWYDNANHTGNPISDPTSVGLGTYYAFLYNFVEDCFNVSSSSSMVKVQVTKCVCKAGTNQIQLSSNTASNKCSAMTVDLTTLNSSLIPSGTTIVWFTNPTHTGNPVANPKAVTAGTYYAFIYDAAMNCYNTANSSAQVKVTINPCVTNVPLNIKVVLQGAMPVVGAKMKNELQTYGGVGLLPAASPYAMLNTYPDINKTDGVVGEVVDWIQVEIRSGTSPQTVLQAKSLLLKPSGAIVDVNGQIPTFNPQSGSVRIVVKHRNHLAIMSNPIQNFSAGSTVSYDFTTAPSQASNVFGDPPQMVQKNGIWCMWAGDLNDIQDLGIDGTDFNDVYEVNKVAPVDTYSIADLNMDGGVDANDYNLVYFNNVIAPYSSLINY